MSMLKMKPSTLRFLTRTMLLLFWSAMAGWASEPKGSPSHGTNIFAPASTPAKSIADLSVFVLVITGIIFVVVFALLVYSVVKFRGRAMDAGREPAQVYGSTQIELAWTIIPILIVVVLFLATARVIHAIQDSRTGRRCRCHRYWTSILVGISLSEAGDHHRQRITHPGQRSQSSDTDVSAIAFGRY
jgi:heme/copper-type cytochrome/quinol oxidase subunit 2